MPVTHSKAVTSDSCETVSSGASGNSMDSSGIRAVLRSSPLALRSWILQAALSPLQDRFVIALSGNFFQTGS